MNWRGLLRRDPSVRVGFELYGQAVAAARAPYFFTVLGVPDTLDGRFDMVALFAILLIRRLGRAEQAGADLAQRVFDAMFSDMDVNLREMGVSDLSVGRKVRTMWEAFHGRANAYGAALDAVDTAALDDTLDRNVWRGAAHPAGDTARLRQIVLTVERHLANQSFDDLARGRVAFPRPEDVAA